MDMLHDNYGYIMDEGYVTINMFQSRIYIYILTISYIKTDMQVDSNLKYHRRCGAMYIFIYTDANIHTPRSFEIAIHPLIRGK